MRQIVLDTETTGLEASLGHRIIEIGSGGDRQSAVDGRISTATSTPNARSRAARWRCTGRARSFCRTRPDSARSRTEFLEFVSGAELIIHNAPFDVAFLDYELAAAGLAAQSRHILPDGHRHAAHGARPAPGQAQQPRRVVRALPGRQLRPHPARRTAGRRTAGRSVSGHDARSGDAPHGHRPGHRGPASWKSICPASSWWCCPQRPTSSLRTCSSSLPSTRPARVLACGCASRPLPFPLLRRAG